MYISFEIEGEKQLSRNLRNVSASMGNWLPTFKKIGSNLVSLFSGPVFDTQGAVIGEPWKPRKKPEPWALLDKTGHMKHGFISKAGSKYVMVTNKVPYFVFHQSNKMPRHHLPRRVMMKIDETRKNQIIHIFNHDMVYKLHKRLA